MNGQAMHPFVARVAKAIAIAGPRDKAAIPELDLRRLAVELVRDLSEDTTALEHLAVLAHRLQSAGFFAAMGQVQELLAIAFDEANRRRALRAKVQRPVVGSPPQALEAATNRGAGFNRAASAFVEPTRRRL